MIYGPSYEGKTRECEACGHFTNVHYDCDHCQSTCCEFCVHHAGANRYCSQSCEQECCEHTHIRLIGEDLGRCADCGVEIEADEPITIPERKAA